MKSRINCKKILELRLESGIMTAHLASDVGISQRMITRMETDESYNPGVITLLLVSEYFNVLIDDLLIKE
jgi:transcriptional regulator with XRE-family HTH domain